MFSAITTPYWTDTPVYIIGGGPSLSGFDFDRIKDKGLLLGVNDAAFNAPCDALFSLDQTWARNRHSQIAEFKGEKILAMPPGYDDTVIKDVTYVVRRRNYGLSKNPDDINGVNSGYGALGVAYLKRAQQIYLLGFDMKDDIERKEGERDKVKAHWYKSYSWYAKTNHRAFHKLASAFDDLIPDLTGAGISVINASPDSLITAFPKCSLSEL